MRPSAVITNKHWNGSSGRGERCYPDSAAMDRPEAEPPLGFFVVHGSTSDKPQAPWRN